MERKKEMEGNGGGTGNGRKRERKKEVQMKIDTHFEWVDLHFCCVGGHHFTSDLIGSMPVEAGLIVLQDMFSCVEMEMCDISISTNPRANQRLRFNVEEWLQIKREGTSSVVYLVLFSYRLAPRLPLPAAFLLRPPFHLNNKRPNQTCCFMATDIYPGNVLLWKIHPDKTHTHTHTHTHTGTWPTFPSAAILRCSVGTSRRRDGGNEVQ